MAELSRPPPGGEMEYAQTRRKVRFSVQLKFISAFLLIIAALIVLMNTYPIIATRDTVFASKQSSLSNQASVMSASLSVLDTLTAESVSQVMELLDVSLLGRVIVTDPGGLILYDTSDAEQSAGKYALFSEISLALTGKTVFYSRYSADAFASRAAYPVRSGGVTIGSVYLYDYDSEPAELIRGMMINLRSVSFGVCALALMLVIVFTWVFAQRVTELVQAIRIVREGEYDYRTQVRGNDELSELAQEFNNLTQRLQDTDDLRRRFVSDASHELKTPLASIRLLSDSIVQSSDMDTDTMRDFVVDIGTEAERLQRTTGKLLSLTKLDADERGQDGVPVDVRTVAERTLHMLSPLAEKRDVRLDFHLDENCVILATEDDLYQIIFNLVENGIKYNHPSGFVRLTLDTENDLVRLMVEDSGVGIPEKDLPFIFDRFYRVDKARSREAGGSGLGLSIVKDAVRLYGGEVSVDAREDGGSRFTVLFPLYTGEEVRE